MCSVEIFCIVQCWHQFSNLSPHPYPSPAMCLSHKCEQGIMANSHLIFLPLSRGGRGLTAYNNCVPIYQNTSLPCCILRQSFIALRYFGEKVVQLNEVYMTGLLSRPEARDYHVVWLRGNVCARQGSCGETRTLLFSWRSINQQCLVQFLHLLEASHICRLD